MTRALGLDHGEARCGVAVSDPTGELVTPLDVVERPDTRRGLARVADVVREREAEVVVVGLPLTLAGEEGAQAQAARAFAERLSQAVDVPVELHDERLTTRMAERTGGAAASDSVAAAHLLESWLQARRAAR
jgi:putative Holliday junction resolvase